MIDNEFEWDDAKASATLTKHGISFEQARSVFDDPFAVRIRDIRRDYGEERLIVVGVSGDDILFVAYTEREGRMRVVSARRANRHERQAYDDDQE